MLSGKQGAWLRRLRNQPDCLYFVCATGRIRSRHNMSHAGHHALSMYDSARQRREKKLWLAIGLSGLLSTMLATSSLFYPSPRQMVTHFLESHVQASPSPADRFVGIAQDVDIGGALDLRPLGALCANRTWREGLVFRLADTTGGGMGNVKNAFLNSLRFAIEAGGEAAPIEAAAGQPASPSVTDLLHSRLCDAEDVPSRPVRRQSHPHRQPARLLLPV
jgi:hypothetical protein